MNRDTLGAVAQVLWVACTVALAVLAAGVHMTAAAILGVLALGLPAVVKELHS